MEYKEDKNKGAPQDAGRQIGETMRDALNTGDLSKLGDIGEPMKEVANDVKNAMKDVGAAVKDAVKDIPGVSFESRGKPGSATPATRPQGQSAQRYQQPQRQAQPQRPVWQGQGTRRAAKPRNYAGVPGIVLGILGVVLFSAMAIGFATVDLFWWGASNMWSVASAFSGVALIASVLFTASGFGKHNFTGRLLNYQQLLTAKPVMGVEELAAATNQTVVKVKKDIKKGLKKGSLRYVWFNEDETTIIYGENAYHQYRHNQQMKRQQELEEAERARAIESDPQLAELEHIRAEGRATLEKIRAANAAIPGEEISAKLELLEETTGKIFACVDQRPNKIGEIQRFMSYYLPTTLKMVDKYAQYEQMEVQTPSIMKSRGEIENALDTVNVAFANLLDSLYHEDTLDVSTDIEVMQTLLEQEGLTGRRFEINAEGEEDSAPTLKL